MLPVRLEAHAGTPIYLQIVNQVRLLVASGQLAPGRAMPPIRNLARQLGINPNTVARAYRELEKAGIVASRQGSGTMITGSASPRREDRIRILREKADELLVEARYLDVSLSEVIDLLRERSSGFEPPREDAFEDPFADEGFLD